MTARILEVQHWRAAQARRATRRQADIRAAHSVKPKPSPLLLNDVTGPAFDPSGGAA